MKKLKLRTAVFTALVSAVLFACMLAGCRDSARDMDSRPVAVTGVLLNKTTISLEIGARETLTATVTPLNATNKNVIWSSNNTPVAAVDSKGNVTARKEGRAVITVTTKNRGKKATCIITVKAKAVNVTGVTLNKTNVSLDVGDVETLTAIVTPANATNKNVSWSSDKTDVAAVNSNGKVTAKKEGQAVITVTTQDGGKKATCTVTVKAKTVAVTGVTLNKSASNLAIGAEETLTAIVTPANATNKNVSWSSDKTDVAAVNSNGKVTAKKEGQAVITVTTQDGNFTAKCTITVKAKIEAVNVTGVTLNKSAANLEIGDVETLTATVTPANATNKNVSWSSANTEVAAVDSNGKVTAKKEGQAIITVTTQDGGKKATCTVTVKAKTVAVTGVTLNKSAANLEIGDVETLTAMVTPANATNKNVSWSSANTEVAAVDSNGKVTAKKEGQAVITVTTQDGGKKATCTVTVKAKTVAVTGVTLNKSAVNLEIGDVETLTATVTPANATNKNVSWSSDKTDVAAVDSNGKVTAKKEGQAVIIVTTQDGGKKATCTVTVKAKTVAVTGVTLNKSAVNLDVEAEETLTAIVTPANATNKNVYWSSDKTDVAAVDSNGKVTAKKEGQAVITVTTQDGNFTAKCTVTVERKPKKNTAVLILEPGEIKIMAETEDGSAITVEGCIETSFKSIWNYGKETILHPTAEKVILKGKIIKLSCCENDTLKAIDVKGLTSLEELECTKNKKLTELDVQGLPSLRELSCFMNNLSKLNVQDTPLQRLKCYINNMPEINIQGLKYLKELDCGGNKLTELNVQGLTSLERLVCSRNQLRDLNVKGLPLQELECYANSLNREVFIKLFYDLFDRTGKLGGICRVYTIYTNARLLENNYTNFTSEELKIIHDKNWRAERLISDKDDYEPIGKKNQNQVSQKQNQVDGMEEI